MNLPLCAVHLCECVSERERVYVSVYLIVDELLEYSDRNHVGGKDKKNGSATIRQNEYK